MDSVRDPHHVDIIGYNNSNSRWRDHAVGDTSGDHKLINSSNGMKQRSVSVYGINDEHVLYDDYTRSFESAPAPRTNPDYRHVDAVILDYSVLEKQEKHTVFKVAVRCGTSSWSVYRRYRDFVVLNDKVKKRFPGFQLNLPPKRYLMSSFNPDFLRHRQRLLQEYLNNLLQLKAAEKCHAVTKFFRLDKPPTADEDLEVAKDYCRNLSETINMQSTRLLATDDQLKNAIGELEEVTVTNERLRSALEHLRKSSQEKEQNLSDKLKRCEEQLRICQDREKEMRAELEHITEQNRREREVDLKAKKLNQEKKELAVRELLMKYEETQLEIKHRIGTCLEPLRNARMEGPTGDAEQDTAITDWQSMVKELEDVLSNAESLMKCYHEHVVEGVQSEVQCLKAQLAKNEYRLQTMESDCNRYKNDYQKLDGRYKDAVREFKSEKEDSLRNLRSQVELTAAIEKRYFHHMILLIKMSLMGVKPAQSNINKIDAEELYDQVRLREIPVDQWPAWIMEQIKRIN